MLIVSTLGFFIYFIMIKCTVNKITNTVTHPNNNRNK